MFVRPLNPDEVLSALHLIWEVYASDVAPLQNPEAVAGFRELIRYEHIMPRIQNKEVILFGAWEGTELCGVGGINNRGNVLFLYVRKEWMRKGSKTANAGNVSVLRTGACDYQNDSACCTGFRNSI